MSVAEPRAVIVTGGGTGIGRATARAFAERGDRVLVVGRTEHTLAEAAEGWPGIRTLVVDIAAEEAPEAIVTAALDQFGRIDVLVNNAAAFDFATLGALDRKRVDEQVATNLLAPVFLTQCALDALADTQGQVVNVSTAASLGLRTVPAQSIYCATKAAMDLLTRSWAVELAPRGIRVVAVAPGVTNTGVGVRAGMTEEQYAGLLGQLEQRIPVGRVGAPEDIAWWIVRLTEPGARYLNGAVVAVDGGLSVT